MRRTLAQRTRLLLALGLVSTLAACRAGDLATAADGGGARDTSLPDSEIVAGLDVPTAKGTLHGALSGSVRSFRGIPFAAPPTGEKRWQPPQPAEAWSGTRDATKAGSMCPQPDMLSGAYTGDEDCLFVSVWTPNPAPQKPLPVMVWFHGGAFTFGSGSDAIYDGSHLVERGPVVIVTTNYRLGALGYLAHPAISQAAGTQVSGDYGLMDQRAALEWVKSNIAAFGGDATNVTIFGESAGARSVCAQLVSAPSRGLFKRAIAESGICMMPTYALADAESQGQRFAKQLGCAEPETALDCLKHKSAADLVAAAGAPAMMPGGTFYQDRQQAFVFGPTIDGVNLEGQMLDLMARRERVNVPLLHGANTDEGILFTESVLGPVKEVSNAAEYETALSSRFRAEDVARIVSEYPLAAYENPNAALTDVTADAFLVCPERKVARLLAGLSIETYLYSFGTPLTGTPIPVLAGKAFHTSELPFVFGNSYALGSVSPESQPIADQIQDYWLRFARTGDPNGSDAPVWPPYTEADDQSMSFRDTSAVDAGLKKERCDFWDSVEPLELP